jgi:hypothetical protein
MRPAQRALGLGVVRVETSGNDVACMTFSSPSSRRQTNQRWIDTICEKKISL